MPRRFIKTDVFNEAINRMAKLYSAGHRIVVSFSAGKDSTCCLEVCRIAARETGRLPVEVILRDEEIMYPGTYEYAERIAADPEISFTWLVANQPIINIFNREQPYFWVFDPLVDPELWVRKPPSWATYITELNIEHMTIPKRFPLEEGQGLFAVIGLRVQESRSRLMGLFSSGGYLTKPNKFGVRNARPIYDWTDSDVWRAIKENKWDYNHSYDTLYKMGVPTRSLRVAPPTMNGAGLAGFQYAAAAWPNWYGRVCRRLPGTKTAIQFGKRAVQPRRKQGESWQETYQRECIDRSPAWIADRATKFRENQLSIHAAHASYPLPDVEPCRQCRGTIRSWKQMALILYTGDPFSIKTPLPIIEPDYFRPGSGFWNGTPSF